MHMNYQGFSFGVSAGVGFLPVDATFAYYYTYLGFSRWVWKVSPSGWVQSDECDRFIGVGWSLDYHWHLDGTYPSGIKLNISANIA